ncbi:solute carrier family 22 member 23-like [Sinocyclocheilus grahami]|uniref:solute carrier family 22 member 23-like n=1 Tax=Sinocyclocheilus grahami TaxID=75366 RepID=UPI0007ACABFF|nr:PREDICTED: solute carrier family 22 member 23-like [Sinocyclocheilus grahami]
MDAVQLDGLNPSPAENGSVSQSEPHKRLSQVDTVVLPFLGGFGRYQRRLVALTWIPAFLISFSQFSDHFLLGQPERKCVRPDQNRTSSVREIFDLITTGNEGSNVTACMCSEWRFELQSGLQQNVVTKTGADNCLNAHPNGQRDNAEARQLMSARFLLKSEKTVCQIAKTV